MDGFDPHSKRNSLQLIAACPALLTARYSLHAVGELVAASAVVEFIGLSQGGLSGASQDGDDGSPPNPESSAATRRSSASASAAPLDHGDQPESSAMLPPALAGAHRLSEAASPNDCAPLPAFSGLASGSTPNAAMIFERGVSAAHCLLILQASCCGGRRRPSVDGRHVLPASQGRVRCLCGNDGVTADKGPWDLLAESAVRVRRTNRELLQRSRATLAGASLHRSLLRRRGLVGALLPCPLRLDTPPTSQRLQYRHACAASGSLPRVCEAGK